MRVRALWTRRIVFALIPVICFLALTEGLARWIWRRLEEQTMAQHEQRGQALLHNKAINFMMMPDRRYTFILKPGYSREGSVVNAQGFAQREVVPVERVPGKLRVLALGESTTQGDHVDNGNYPALLRRLLALRGHAGPDVEMINAGVAGWLSDQLAERTERQLAAFQPDVVVLYVGWNDFQNYDPLGPSPQVSTYDDSFRGLVRQHAAGYVKSVALLSALYQKRVLRKLSKGTSGAAGDVPLADIYRFYTHNLDRIVTAFRRANPHVQIVMSTLVGRWPQESEAVFERLDCGRTRWMQQHDLSHEEAAACLNRFNQLVRQYAAEHGLLLIDAAATFEPLDRGRLQYDFCHMLPDGYELLAETIYAALCRQGIVQGAESPRRQELLTRYHPTASVNQ